MFSKVWPISFRVVCMVVVFAAAGRIPLSRAAAQAATTQQAAPKSRVRAVGTIKAINGNTIVLTTDTGSEMNVVVQPSTRLLRTLPGETDIKRATPIQLPEVEVGDRMLAGGTPSDDGKSVMATTAVVMKKADVAQKHQSDLQVWQKHGVGGVVKAIDPSSGTITLSTSSLDPKITLAVKVSTDTILRRYAPDSVKFDDAGPGTLEQIKAGDQLRARGTRSADGSELVADEIVSGAFRNISGTVMATDQGQNTVSVMDLATKHPVTLKITPDSQLHQLPAMMAQRIAARLKAQSAGAGAAASPAGPAAGAQSAPQGNGAGARAGGPSDFQQMLARMPAVTLADLHKGDALMIVATEGSPATPSSAIILLSGVEPILTASPKQAQTMLSPWNLSAGGNAGTGDTP